MSFSLPPLLDTALDRAVIPGYSRLGYWARSSGWPKDDPTPDALKGTTVLVTGANSGVGKATSEAVARLGATVLMTVRNRERGEQARQEILAAVPDADVRLELCDVSDLAGVETFAAELSGRIHRLDVLIH
ncbi:MAG: SDR family NAD(P)-dependent oxidoreductase, partial [Mycobacteriaceae bacterium]